MVQVSGDAIAGQVEFARVAILDSFHNTFRTIRKPTGIPKPSPEGSVGFTPSGRAPKVPALGIERNSRGMIE
jgi:hypothetical protein